MAAHTPSSGELYILRHAFRRSRRENAAAHREQQQAAAAWGAGSVCCCGGDVDSRHETAATMAMVAEVDGSGGVRVRCRGHRLEPLVDW